MADLFDLTGKVVVVTGGSRGLGRAMSLAFARQGASVVVASRKLEQCEAVTREISGSPAVPATVETLAVACHVGRWPDCDGLIDQTLDRFGRLDILVNNAGMSPLYASLGDVTEELFDKVIGVNLKGPFRLAVRAAEHMRSAGGGCVINISSVAAVHPSEAEVPYAAAKAGLNTLTAALAHAFGPTVRVNGIMPGTFMTDVVKAWDLDDFRRRAQSYALRRGGEPEEIVGAVLYLASAASSFTTGSIITVDGGMTSAPWA